MEYKCLVTNFVITGGTSGIGLEVSKKILSSGDRILIFSRNLEKFQQIKPIFESKKVESSFVQVDFENLVEYESLIEREINNFENIDVLINNVGASLKFDENCSIEDYSRVININLLSVHLMTKLSVNQMLRNSIKGKIFTISSMAALNLDGLLPYVTAKHAVDAYIRLSAKNLSGTGITHIGIRPGPVNVPGRFLTNLELQNKDEFINWCRVHNYSPMKLCKMEDIAELIDIFIKTKNYFFNGSIINMSDGTL